MKLRHRDSMLAILGSTFSSTVGVVGSAVVSLASAVASYSVLWGSLAARRRIERAGEADPSVATEDKPVAEIYQQHAVSDADTHIRNLAKARKPYANVPLDMID
jgi:hypothetical protein